MKIVISTIFGLACLTLVLPAQAGNACGPACCNSCGHKVCRVVCGMKEIKKTVWVVECEEFCVPNPHCPRDCCKSSCCQESACGDTCDGCCASGGGCHHKCLVPPKCGPVRCRKKLIKKEIVCKVPVYKCTVCGACGEACCDESPTIDETPAAPSRNMPAAPSPTAWQPKASTGI